MVVFDDYQELPSAAPVHQVLREGLSQLPPGGRAIIVSRSEPPATLARLRANETIRLVGGTDLRLTQEEANAIARIHLQRRAPPDTLRALHEATQGWAAGLVLLLERLKAGDLATPSLQRLAPEALFDYFAGEVFDRMDGETREVLLKTALLPTMTAGVVREVTGSPRAARILADLARAQYFTIAHSEVEPAYEYHPLFRGFLLARATDIFRADGLSAIRRRAAAVLEAAGQVEPAVALYREAGDWDEVARLIVVEAPTLMAQGRGLTLQQWLRSLPADRMEGSPWLLYWLGASCLPADPGESHQHFARAFALLRDRHDDAGALLAWSGAVDAIVLERATLARLDPWIAELEAWLASRPAFPSPEVEARVICSMLAAGVVHRPDQPEMGRWAARAETLLESRSDPSLTLLTGFYLATYFVWMGDLSRTSRIFGLLLDIGRSPRASPQTLIAGHYARSHASWLVGDAAACLREMTQGLQIAERTGVHLIDPHLVAIGLYGALSAGMLEIAAELLQRMKAGVDPDRLMDTSHYEYVAGWHAWLRGNPPDAHGHLERCLQQTLHAGIPFPTALTSLALAQLEGEEARFQAADAHLERARAIGRRTGSRLLDYMCRLVEARLGLDRGEKSAALSALRAAMATGREQGFVNFPWWRSSFMSRLCLTALEHGIEVEYVRALIRRRGLVPETPPLDVEAWPWTVRIVTLGHFEIRVRDRPLAFRGKTQKKPIALLKALIALGGRSVREEALMDALWTDADGDAAGRALTTTLHRTRRLLGSDVAVSRREGHLGLDPWQCWVDVWALEHWLARAEAASTPEDIARVLEPALRLYPGPFLGAENEPPGSAAMRARLRSRLLRALDRLARQWEVAGESERAVVWCQRALELDDCAEGLYRRLMAVYQRLGRRAEALALYARCRQRLAAVLGVEPDPETEALYRSLRPG